jgi:hypothetical protein
MSDLSIDTKKHTTKSRETIPLRDKPRPKKSCDTVSLAVFLIERIYKKARIKKKNLKRRKNL